MKTAYLRYAIQRCCCCIKKSNCYIIGCEIRNYGSLIIQQNEASCLGFPAQEAFCADEQKSYSRVEAPLPHLDVWISFAAMDVSNAFQLYGVLPQNKETLLHTFDRT